MTRPIAFYAPLKEPGHPVPSGDRTMARLLLAALARAGYDPGVMSTLRTHEPAGDPARQAAIREASRREADRIVADLLARPREQRPLAWFTYHVYYKAPDWIGPAVARALDIPYVVAEGSRAGKRANGPWALGHAGAEAALRQADVLLAMTAADREAFGDDPRLIDLPPFIDAAAWPRRPSSRVQATPRLVTVAMMRAGDKLDSYRLLAEALGLSRADWILDIVGDGPARPEVETLFAPLRERVSFLDRADGPESLAPRLMGADLLVWPAVREAYGMALLEAQASGVPVLAGAYGGVPDVVRDGETGRLAPPGDAAAFAATLDGLLADRAALARMGEAAARFVRAERDLDAAAARLGRALAPLTEAACA